MKTPELKQFGELDAEDFQRHPVWIGCHTADYGKPWYDDTDEETFRPYIGKLPADPAEGIFLVRAVIELRDGSCHTGFVTPAMEEDSESKHVLGTQQPHIFVSDRQFGFWGGMLGIPSQTQRELYAALGKAPESIFPLRFSVDPALATGNIEGEVDGFYRRDRGEICVAFADNSEERADGGAVGPKWFRVLARAHRGYPQPERNFDYVRIAYEGACPRCGIFERQIAPFHFKKSRSPSPPGFTQLNWVFDAFFASPVIAEEITRAGITGVSFAPVVYHRTGTECTDRVQLKISSIIACAETSRLSSVTCRPLNEEVLAMRAMFAKRKPSGARRRGSVLSPELQEKLRRDRERFAALPYCGRVKHHPPTSLALIPDNLKGAPDLFQTAEWFGSGGSAFRLTLASERFVNLVGEHNWKGLIFHSVSQSGWSERTSI